MNTNDFRKPTRKEKNNAIEISEALGFEYSKLSKRQMRVIYAVVKDKHYNHQLLLKIIEENKNKKTMFLIFVEYSRHLKKFIKQTNTPERGKIKNEQYLFNIPA